MNDIASPDVVLVAATRAGRQLGSRAVLTDAELVHAESLGEDRRLEYLEGRALLRWAAAQVLGSDAPPQPIALRKSGKPYLPLLPHVGVSISHSRRLRVAAVAYGREVGIDVEDPIRPDAALLRRCCEEGERSSIARLAPALQTTILTRIWTAQEACLKASGDGLRGRPSRVPVRAFATQGQWRSYAWRALPLSTDDGLALAVSRGFGLPLKIVVIAPPSERVHVLPFIPSVGERSLPWWTTGSPATSRGAMDPCMM